MKGLCGKMVLRIKRKSNNRIFTVYLLAMFALMVLRYLLDINVPSLAFLLVAMVPIWCGTKSEHLAFAVSCIPLSIAFQYKYALLIFAAAILLKNRWHIRRSGVLILVVAMMIWELWHAFYGYFSYVEYLRDFAELILLGVVTSIDLHDVDHKLIVRCLSISVVGVCVIMLIMQLQQFGFDLAAVFARSARSFRFGQSNMAAGDFALNFNANNLGFICNLSTCGCLLLAARKEHKKIDIVLALFSAVFALMTMSRAAIVCMVMVFVAYLLLVEGKITKKILSGFSGILLAVVALILIQAIIPSVFENIRERFQRSDVWNGRGNLMKDYGDFLMSSPLYLFFGIGMQQIFEKVSSHIPVADVPHLGIQEICVAWGLVGVVLRGIVIWKIVVTSKRYAEGKRQLYQFMPLLLTLVFTMTGQLLTSSRALMALTFSYICLCVKKNAPISEGEPDQSEET